MTTLTITAKGQVTLKQALLRHLGVKPGQKVHVDILPDGRVVLQAAHTGQDINAVFGVLEAKNPQHKVLSIETISEITRQSWADKP